PVLVEADDGAIDKLANLVAEHEAIRSYLLQSAKANAGNAVCVDHWIDHFAAIDAQALATFFDGPKAIVSDSVRAASDAEENLLDGSRVIVESLPRLKLNADCE